jgi:hypothetical protein
MAGATRLTGVLQLTPAFFDCRMAGVNIGPAFVRMNPISTSLPAVDRLSPSEVFAIDVRVVAASQVPAPAGWYDCAA